MPDPVPFWSSFFPFGRHAVGLVAAFRGSSFWLGHWVGSVHPLLFFHIYCLLRHVSQFARTSSFAFLRYSSTSCFIKLLRIGSSSVCTVDATVSSSEWMLCTFLSKLSNMVVSSTMNTTALHFANSSLTCFCRHNSLEPALWLTGIDAPHLWEVSLYHHPVAWNCQAS